MGEPTDGGDDGPSAAKREGQRGLSDSRAEEFVTRTLQYEWADTIVANPPETEGISWVPGNIGDSWGRVAPDAWSVGREFGVDLYFRHHPTPELFGRGTFHLELTVDTVEDGNQASPADENLGTLREVLADAVAHDDPDELVDGSWVESTLVEDDEHVLWRATYNFSAGDDVAYHETLQTAIEDHAWIVPLVTDAFQSMANDLSD
ncbi:hypothetical protein C453_11701 [Haloferax elongans ATCC BAA-1513]|uniref:DUF4268 domain-containing protein n=1 Tax=Haloferax elongans ATCC BAA-1513 TaxID=1230453 RepID=M0HLT1_HALEO|nr:hypothetical protein [Haloferax elongans]ELZ84677.1 hypothetical protein C453_11701 [Haloferax elongans ATCC BAA-1513]